uniref:Uncharacterized protein n=1 Tax=Ixodes ricinus TaxID=34613 RepID=A0A6B0UWK5_IXORI
MHSVPFGLRRGSRGTVSFTVISVVVAGCKVDEKGVVSWNGTGVVADGVAPDVSVELIFPSDSSSERALSSVVVVVSVASVVAGAKVELSFTALISLVTLLGKAASSFTVVVGVIVVLELSPFVVVEVGMDVAVEVGMDVVSSASFRSCDVSTISL